MLDLTREDSYQYWRDEKIARAPLKLSDCMLEIHDPFKLTASEKNKLLTLCQNTGFALFSLAAQNDYPSAIIQFNQQLGLVDFDAHLYAKHHGLAYITPTNHHEKRAFIPYTDKAIGWHTDGYYNTLAQRIRAFSLFCVNPADNGGENAWIDPQMVYVLLREANPEVAKALTHPEAMTIPEHRADGKVRRATATGAIFFMDEPSAELSMRYTQRGKHIKFCNSTEITQAVDCLNALLNHRTEYHFEHKMHAGQGIICNNILHKRASFVEDIARPRLLLRGRYFNRLRPNEC